MDEFVCVRVVKANGMDLNLLQFDFDLTFAIVLMHPDGTIYGRFGSRSDRHEAEKDISLEGLAETLGGALQLHRDYAAVRTSLAGKQPRTSEYRFPSDYPALKGKFAAKLDYDGQVVKSCLHCHQIRDAQRDMYRSRSRPIPDQLLFPYPMPAVIGLEFDPRTANQVARVAAGSIAAQAGIQAGDRITALDGQPLLSLADVQWVLHHASDRDTLSAALLRNGAQREAVLELPDGWRRRTDIQWRVSTWPLRRMGTGGLVLEATGADGMALRVTHVGQYGAHAAAKRAGFRTGDIVVSFDGRTDLDSEAELLAYAMQHTLPGQQVAVEVLRGDRRLRLQLPMQK